MVLINLIIIYLINGFRFPHICQPARQILLLALKNGTGQELGGTLYSCCTYFTYYTAVNKYVHSIAYVLLWSYFSTFIRLVIFYLSSNIYSSEMCFCQFGRNLKFNFIWTIIPSVLLTNLLLFFQRPTLVCEISLIDNFSMLFMTIFEF